MPLLFITHTMTQTSVVDLLSDGLNAIVDRTPSSSITQRTNKQGEKNLNIKSMFPIRRPHQVGSIGANILTNRAALRFDLFTRSLWPRGDRHLAVTHTAGKIYFTQMSQAERNRYNVTVGRGN